MRLVYGPVPSRRFGLSLGVDVVSFKSCPYDCVYCQLGPTTCLTSERESFFDRGAVLADIEAALAKGPAPDVITFAGSGEPTLYMDLEGLVRSIREITPTPLVLLTNSALLHDPAVARAAALFDVVGPSLDAGDEETWRRMNRPVSGLGFAQMVDALVGFRDVFSGVLRVEVFFAAGINDDDAQLGLIRGILDRVNPDRIDINTAVRPVPGGGDLKVSDEFLVKAQWVLGEKATVIAGFRRDGGAAWAEGEADERFVIESLGRRPQTLHDLAIALDAHPDSVLKALSRLTDTGRVQPQARGGETYWLATHDGGSQSGD